MYRPAVRVCRTTSKSGQRLWHFKVEHLVVCQVKNVITTLFILIYFNYFDVCTVHLLLFLL